MEDCPVCGNGILCEAAIVCSNLVKSSYTVAWAKFIDVFADGMDNASDVVAAVVGQVLPMCNIIITDSFPGRARWMTGRQPTGNISNPWV